MKFIKCSSIDRIANGQESSDDIDIIKSIFNGTLKPSVERIAQYRATRRMFGDDMEQKFVFASYVSKEFPYTYKKKGLIFETNSSEVFRVYSLDSMILHSFISDFKVPKDIIEDNFVFKNMTKFLNKIKYVTNLINMVKTLSKKYPYIVTFYTSGSEEFFNGFYNEVQFKTEIKINPIAFFGISTDERKKIAHKVGNTFLHNPLKLPIYRKAVDYFKDEDPQFEGEE